MLKKMSVMMAVAMITLPIQATADAAFDACVRKLCVSKDQMDCWVKSGAELCDDDGACSDIPDHAGARILKKRGGSWRVETNYGRGWVDGRYMLVDGSLCDEQ